MKKKLAAIAFAGASLAMFAGAPSAGAAHCVAPDGSAPGYSYFGTVHVQNADHPEGQGVHAGTSGASSCRSADAGAGLSPSDRAPGQNR